MVPDSNSNPCSFFLTAVELKPGEDEGEAMIKASNDVNEYTY